MVGFILSIVISSCGREAPPDWQWWTKGDSTAVYDTLKLWRTTFNGFNFLCGQNNAQLIYPLEITVPLTSSDTISRTGTTLVKIGNFLGGYYQISDSTHIDDLLFEVKNDSIETKDTFCFITYQDTSENCIAKLRYNRLWIVHFQVSAIDTTVSPWDSTWRVSSINDSLCTDTLVAEDTFHFTAMRKLELKKDSSATSYRMKYITGFTLYVPNSTDAPAVSNVVLSQLTRIDTFYSGARQDKKGIYNPKLKDSLYTIAKDESITVTINTSTPSDTASDRNYFFVSCGTPYISAKYNITSSPTKGIGKVAFSTSGIHHLYIEVIPASALFYPNAQRKSTTWSIPILVTQ
jgi:hypothetical protein